MRWAILLAPLIGCSSASFEVAPSNAPTNAIDSATAETSTDDGLEASEIVDTTAGADAIPGETTSSCAPLGEVTEVWVDAKSAFSKPTGTADCPFRHIAEAVAFVNSLTGKPRAIRVRAGTYNESSAIVLRPQITLQGAGAMNTTISGGGSCMGIGMCIVRVEGGATLEGVAVDAAPTAKHGVVTGNTDPGGLPVIRNVRVYGAVGDGNAGILASSGAQLGPNVESSGNRFGLVIWGNQKVSITGGNNKFDKNAQVGIAHDGSGPLTFLGGGSASGNGEDGIRVGNGTTATPPIHDLAGLTIVDNVNAGIRVGPTASIVLRSSKVVGNKFGVIALFGAMNSVDLGTAADGGNNTFAGSVRNQRVGLCAVATRATAMPAVNNRWSSCAVEARSLNDISLSAACEAIASYADVYYRGMTAPDTSMCAVGS